MKLKKGLEKCKDVYSGHLKFLERVEKDLQFNDDESNNSDEIESEYLGKRALDFQKIKQLLLTAKDSKKICALLEALRWRVSRSQTVLEKRENCLLLISNDLLEERVTRGLFEQGQPNVIEHLLALINVLAGDFKGRSYLEGLVGLSEVLIKLLITDGKSEVMDGLGLFILQKMSLRRQIQNLLIKRGVIEWAVKKLCQGKNRMKVYR